jgi:hypothetical protein
MPQKHPAEAVSPMFPVHNDVLQQNHKTSFRRADGKEQVNHPEDFVTLSQHKNPAPIGLLENQAQPAHLFGAIRRKIGFLSEQIKQEIC